MNEAEAEAWIAARYGDQSVDRLRLLAAEIVAENSRQNLIAPSTVASIWTRHLLDSAQLVALAPPDGLWLDIGSGAGLPGIVVAILRYQPTVLIEPRRQRADHLRRCVERLELSHVEVRQERVERTRIVARVISARAVAPVEKLLQAAAACGTTHTRWLLPRGTFDDAELTRLKNGWGGVFHMKQSLTSSDSTVLICDGPTRR